MRTRTLLHTLSLIIALSTSFFGQAANSLAHPALPQTEGNRFSLEQLNILEPIPLIGPLNTQFVNFRFPADWALAGGAELRLSFDTAVPGFQELEIASSISDTLTGTAAISATTRAAGIPVTPARFGGNLRVVMNNVPLAIVPLNRNGTGRCPSPFRHVPSRLPRPTGCTI